MPVFWQIAVNKLEEQFMKDVHELLANDPAGWYVTSGLRSMEEQQSLWEQGRTKPGEIVTNAKPGQSAHNYGRAVDVALDGSPKPGLQMLWNWRNLNWLRLRAKIAMHPRLHSGWTWGDWPHIEVYQWRTRPTPIVPVQNLHGS